MCIDGQGRLWHPPARTRSNASACSPTWLRITWPSRVPGEDVSDPVVIRASTSGSHKLQGAVGARVTPDSSSSKDCHEISR